MAQQHRNALPPGYRLENFCLGSVLGHGGFGITYRALDEDLRQAVAIKEYLPREVAFRDRDSTVLPLSETDRETFEWGLQRFLDEARTLAHFRHSSIVGVRRFIRANGTAYLVMDYCKGESLESLLAREGTLSEGQLESLLEPLLNALETLHEAGVTHRDIKPGNIYLREDGCPVLLDFGAARQALVQHSRSVTAMATPGYAALEQYSTKGTQGPWTDIYGLGATLYRSVTGQRPPDASDRMLKDELVLTEAAASGRYPCQLFQQIDMALRLRPEERPQSVSAWRLLGSHDAPAQTVQDQTGGTEAAEPNDQVLPNVPPVSKPPSGSPEKYSCPKCGYSETTFFDICPRCEITVEKVYRSPVKTRLRLEATNSRSVHPAFLLFGGVVAFILFLIAGTVHYLIDPQHPGNRFVKKENFGFSENIINVDKIVSLPRAAAREAYPVGFMVLQREGIIETDEEIARKLQLRRDLRRAREVYERLVGPWELEFDF